MSFSLNGGVFLVRVPSRAVSLRRGFSLLEVLVSLTIVGILGGIMIGIGVKAIGVATNTLIVWEIAQLNEAMEDFAIQFGSYPPDFHDRAAALKYIKEIFPKCPRSKYPDIDSQDPASALVFWLTGPKGRGFSTDPTDPFGDGPNRIGPFIKLSKERLRPKGSSWRYYPPNISMHTPYLYFRADSKKGGYDGNPGWHPARPYKDSKTDGWIHPTSFQILCAGQDGKYGHGRNFPKGDDYDEANYDDIANFTRGSTMRNAMPAKPK